MKITFSDTQLLRINIQSLLIVSIATVRSVFYMMSHAE